MKHFRSIRRKAHGKFPMHKWLRIRVKTNPSNPFNNMVFDKIIRDSISLDHYQYAIYIHDNYLSIRSLQFLKFEPIKIWLDRKLWVELYCVFDIDDTDDDNYIFENLKDVDDKPI